MERMVTLPALGAVLFGAAALGGHLGQSAIDNINPLYFQGAAVHPSERGAEVFAAGFAPSAARFGDHYGWEEGQAARNADCGGCEALAARDAYRGGEVAPAVIETGWRNDTRPIVYEDEPAPDDDQLPAGPELSADVERYASYAIEEKPAEAEFEEEPEPVEADLIED